MIISMLQKTPRDFGFSCNSQSVAYLAVCCVQFVTEEREPKKKTREMHYNTVFILNVQCSAFIMFLNVNFSTSSRFSNLWKIISAI